MWPMRTASSGDAGARGQVARRRAPGLALLAGDQQEAPGRDEVLDRAAAAVLVVDPRVRERRARAGGRLVDADLVAGSPGAGLPSGTIAADSYV